MHVFICGGECGRLTIEANGAQVKCHDYLLVMKFTNRRLGVCKYNGKRLKTLSSRY